MAVWVTYFDPSAPTCSLFRIHSVTLRMGLDLAWMGLP